MLDLARIYNNEEFSEVSATVSLTDAEILKAHDHRVLRRTKNPPPTDNEEARNTTAQNTDAVDGNSDAPKQEDDDAWLR